MATTDIIFDVKTVDVQLAETYVNTRSELHSIGFIENGSYEYDKFKNKIYLTGSHDPLVVIDGTASHSDTLDKLYNLAKLIEKNADLFCQLEYLIRGIPVDDVKKCDLKLITDNLLYCYKAKRNKEAYDNIYCDRIAFLADTPLAALGFIAQSLCCGRVNKNNTITIISNKDTAIICSLFVDLCRQVGFEEVFLQLVSEDEDCSKYNILKIEELSTGCVGIVTSKCDVDSAVDAFLSAAVRVGSDVSSTIIFKNVNNIGRSSQDPWRVKKIFVQECALERFKRALEWKSERRAPAADAEVSCLASYRCGDKVFRLEAAGEGDAPAVSLEPYRTVRELLVLLSASRPLAVSLWSGDVAESGEIAHALTSTVVWVNDLADFRGPPRVSQAFYSVMDSYFSSHAVECGPESAALEALRSSWLARSPEERQELVMQQGEKFSTISLIDEYDFKDSFVRVTGNVVVTGTTSPARILRMDIANASLDASIAGIPFLMRGGGLLVRYLDEYRDPLFQNIFKIKGIPAVCEGNYTDRTIKVLWRPCYEHKVIWTNYGTTFAN